MTLAANGLELDLGYRCGLSDRVCSVALRRIVAGVD